MASSKHRFREAAQSPETRSKTKQTKQEASVCSVSHPLGGGDGDRASVPSADRDGAAGEGTGPLVASKKAWKDRPRKGRKFVPPNLREDWTPLPLPPLLGRWVVHVLPLKPGGSTKEWANLRLVDSEKGTGTRLGWNGQRFSRNKEAALLFSIFEIENLLAEELKREEWQGCFRSMGILR